MNSASLDRRRLRLWRRNARIHKENNNNDSLDNNSPEYEILINRIHNFLNQHIIIHMNTKGFRINNTRPIRNVKNNEEREPFSAIPRAKDDFERSLYITSIVHEKLDDV